MDAENNRVIEAVLHSLGILGASIATRQMICAVALAYEDVFLLQNVTKGLYPLVAKYFAGANANSVERNLRNVRDQQWSQGDVELLRRMSGFNMQSKPTTGEFIDIVRFYIESEGLLPNP